MIGILQNKALTTDKLKKIEEWHWGIVKSLVDKCKADKKYCAELTKLEKILKPRTLKTIVTSNFEKLNLLKGKLPHSRLNIIVATKPPKHILVYLYEMYRKRYGKELIDKLELAVCPYCNRNYINNGMRYATAQFDHFLPKSTYPIFALSLYNLIPSCPTCNHLKREQSLGVSPYDTEQTTDKVIRFSYEPDENLHFYVKVKSLIPKMQQNINVLELQALYQMHNGLADELIQKKRNLVQCNIVSLESLFEACGEKLNMTSEEFYFGNFFTEDKYYLRPLSKFTHDIVDELDKIEK